MNHRTVLRGVLPLLGETFDFDGRPRDVLISAGRIVAIEAAGTIHDADEIIALERHLLVPGLFNSHFHSHENFQKGRTENLPLEIWMHYVRTPVPVPLTWRQAYLRTMVSAIESLRSGATAVVDDITLGATVNRTVIDAALQAYEDLGIRAFVGFAMMNRAVVDNFPFVDTLFPPQLLAQLRALPRPDPDEILATTRALGRERHPDTHRVSVIASASAPMRCTPEFLGAIRRTADEVDLPVITHVQETRLQVVTGQELYGKTLVAHLHALGFLKPKTTLIHTVWLNPREIDMLASTGTTAQHNPWSNLMLGSGIAPVRALLDADVNVSMGTDGCCSTFSTNILNAAGAAAGLGKIRNSDYRRWLTASEALHAASVGGAKALGLDRRLGSIALGKTADLAAFRLESIPFVPLSNPVRQLVYAERGANLGFVMVDGNTVMRDGRLTRIDEASILRQIGAEFETLRQNFEHAEASVAPLHAAMEKIYAACEREAIASDTYRARVDS